MKKVAYGKEPVVGIPVVIPPVKVEVPLRIVPVEVRHVAMETDPRHRTCIKCHPGHCSSSFVLSKLNGIRDLVCRQHFTPTVIFFIYCAALFEKP